MWQLTIEYKAWPWVEHRAWVGHPIEAVKYYCKLRCAVKKLSWRKIHAE